MDELDAVGGHRNTDHGYFRLTINELLTQLDGFKKNEDIIIIGKSIITKLLPICLRV